VPSLHLAELIMAVALLRPQNASEHVWSIKHVPSQRLRLSVVRSLIRTSRLLGIRDDHNLYFEISAGAPAAIGQQSGTSNDVSAARGTILRGPKNGDPRRSESLLGHTSRSSMGSSPSWALDSMSDAAASSSRETSSHSSIDVPPPPSPVSEEFVLRSPGRAGNLHVRPMSADVTGSSPRRVRTSPWHQQASLSSPRTPGRRGQSFAQCVGPGDSPESTRRAPLSLQQLARLSGIWSSAARPGSVAPSLPRAHGVEGGRGAENHSANGSRGGAHVLAAESQSLSGMTGFASPREQPSASAAPQESTLPRRHPPALLDLSAANVKRRRNRTAERGTVDRTTLPPSIHISAAREHATRNVMDNLMNSDSSADYEGPWVGRDGREYGAWLPALGDDDVMMRNDQTGDNGYVRAPDMPSIDDAHLAGISPQVWSAWENTMSPAWGYVMAPPWPDLGGRSELAQSGYNGHGPQTERGNARVCDPYLVRFDPEEVAGNACRCGSEGRRDHSLNRRESHVGPLPSAEVPRRSSGREPIAFRRHRNVSPGSYNLLGPQPWDRRSHIPPEPSSGRRPQDDTSSNLLQRPYAAYQPTSHDGFLRTGRIWDAERHPPGLSEANRYSSVAGQVSHGYDFQSGPFSARRPSRASSAGTYSRRSAFGTGRWQSGTMGNIGFAHTSSHVLSATYMQRRSERSSQVSAVPRASATENPWNSDRESPESNQVLRDDTAEPANGNVPNCVVCLTAEVDTAMKPCFHAKFCESCATRISNTTKQCPLCRCTVTDLQRIFF
jgi:hypothetical protein